MTTTDDPAVDPEGLRASVREKYREVALHPDGAFHFHTGRPLAALLGYDAELVAALPDRAVESFAGVANPFSLRTIRSSAAWVRSSRSDRAAGSTRSWPRTSWAPTAGSSAST